MKNLLLILLSFCFSVAWAQNSSFGESDAAAKAILRKVSSNYKSMKSFRAEVQLVVENASGEKISSSGGTLEMKGNKYYVSNRGNASFSDGANQYNFDKDANEVQITRINPNDNTLTPPKLFTDFYDKNYLYKLNGESNKSGKIIQQIELTPFDKTLPFFKVLLDINKNNSTIEGARIFEKNGNRYAYTITSLKRGVEIANSRFTFNKNEFPGAEVVDLR